MRAFGYLLRFGAAAVAGLLGVFISYAIAGGPYMTAWGPPFQVVTTIGAAIIAWRATAWLSAPIRPGVPSGSQSLQEPETNPEALRTAWGGVRLVAVSACIPLFGLLLLWGCTEDCGPAFGLVIIVGFFVAARGVSLLAAGASASRGNKVHDPAKSKAAPQQLDRQSGRRHLNLGFVGNTAMISGVMALALLSLALIELPLVIGFLYWGLFAYGIVSKIASRRAPRPVGHVQRALPIEFRRVIGALGGIVGAFIASLVLMSILNNP